VREKAFPSGRDWRFSPRVVKDGKILWLPPVTSAAPTAAFQLVPGHLVESGDELPIPFLTGMQVDLCGPGWTRRRRTRAPVRPGTATGSRRPKRAPSRSFPDRPLVQSTRRRAVSSRLYRCQGSFPSSRG
jgi:hypothetical protein